MSTETKEPHPLPIGTYVQITGNDSFHNYTTGGIYRVKHVDPDGTFIGTDAHGVDGDFIRWDDCKPLGLDWDWLRQQIDDRSLDLLTAFDGLHTLRIKEQCANHVILATPNLANAILDLLPNMETPGDDDDPDDDDFSNLPIDLDSLMDDD